MTARNRISRSRYRTAAKDNGATVSEEFAATMTRQAAEERFEPLGEKSELPDLETWLRRRAAEYAHVKFADDLCLLGDVGVTDRLRTLIAERGDSAGAEVFEAIQKRHEYYSAGAALMEAALSRLTVALARIAIENGTTL